MPAYLTDSKDILGKTRITAHKVTKTPPNRSVTGYGGKIATRHMVQIDSSPIWRRVYVMQYANSGSVYVLVNKEILFLSIDCESKLN